MNRTSSPALTSTSFGLFSSRVIVTLPSAHAPPTPSAPVSTNVLTNTAIAFFMLPPRLDGEPLDYPTP